MTRKHHLRGLVGGLVGAVLGALVWYLVAKVSGKKVEAVAISVGVLAGLGVVVGSDRKGWSFQFIGAFAALLGWALGEWLIYLMLGIPGAGWFDAFTVLSVVLAAAAGFGIPGRIRLRPPTSA